MQNQKKQLAKTSSCVLSLSHQVQGLATLNIPCIECFCVRLKVIESGNLA